MCMDRRPKAGVSYRCILILGTSPLVCGIPMNSRPFSWFLPRCQWYGTLSANCVHGLNNVIPYWPKLYCKVVTTYQPKS